MKKLKKVTALALMIMLLLSACNPPKDYERSVGVNYVYYNRDVDQLIIDYWYDTFDFVYDPLTEEELKTLFPVDGPEWLHLSGEAVYSAEGDLIRLELTTPLEQNIDYFRISLGDHVAHAAVFPKYSGLRRSSCGETNYVVMDESNGKRVIYTAMGVVQNQPIEISMADDKSAVDEEMLQENFEQLLIYFSSCPDGALDLSILTPPEEPEWFEFEYTRDEAYTDPELGRYLPIAAADENARNEFWRVKRPTQNELYTALDWEAGIVNWYITDLSGENVEEYLSASDNAVFKIEELTVEAIEEEFTELTSMNSKKLDIDVVYENVMIGVTSYGVDAEAIYNLLTSVPDDSFSLETDIVKELIVGVPSSSPWRSRIEAVKGFRLDYDYYTGSNADIDAQIHTSVYAMEPLPEVWVDVPISFSNYEDYCEDEFLLDLTDYLEDREGASKPMWDYLEALSAGEQDELIERITDSETGQIYRFPVIELRDGEAVLADTQCFVTIDCFYPDQAVEFLMQLCYGE